MHNRRCNSAHLIGITRLQNAKACQVCERGIQVEEGYEVIEFGPGGVGGEEDTMGWEPSSQWDFAHNDHPRK